MNTLAARWTQPIISTDYLGKLNSPLATGRDLNAHEGRATVALSEKVELATADYQATEALLKKQMAESLANVGDMSNITFTPRRGYDSRAEAMALHFVNRNYQEGLEQGKSVDQLTRLVNDSAANIHSAYSKTSSLLDAIGQLGPGQQSFLSNSEYRVGENIDRIHEDIAAKEKGQSDGKEFELTVQTREGDTVTIKLSSAKGEEEDHGYDFNSFQVAYEVEGELSDEEHQALTAIFADVGEMADKYFKTSGSQQSRLFGSTSRDNPFVAEVLKNFDPSQLSNVDLSMGHFTGGKESDERNDHLDYSYGYDEQSQTQNMEVNWQPAQGAGTQFKIDMSTIGGQDPRQLAEYINLIDSSYQEVSRGQSSDMRESTPTSVAMYKAALTEMFEIADNYKHLQQEAAETFTNGRQLVMDLTNQLIQMDERYQGLKDNQAGAFKDGLSNLADFSASFVVGEDEKRGFMKIDMEQKTDVASDSGFQGVEQNKSANTKTLRGYGGVGEREVEKEENYQLKAAIEGQKVVALDQLREANSKEITTVHSGSTRETTIDTQLKDASSLRLIEDIWTQSLEHDKKEKDEFRVYYGNELHSVSVDYQADKEQTMTLIGDSEKLKDNKFMREKYAPALAAVNQFMARI